MFILFPLTVVQADNTTQTPPFSQDWTNAGLITVNDDWSGVPGIVGFLGDYTTSSPTGVDPQTLLQDMTTVDVIANQSLPNTLSNGGVAEFDGIPNPSIALNGSGTADAPSIIINLNTTGLSSITVAYNLRDIDSSIDNAVQQVALQYRAGNSGNFTNVPSGYVADATSGPSLATLVTPVNVTLPAAAENQPLLQVRIMTTNAAGNDEWVGVDDIAVTGSTITLPTNPSGTGSANPNSVLPGESSTLTVNVTPGANPTSTGIAVSVDLSSIGGSISQQFFDDGTNGDVTPSDNVFTYNATVSISTTPGPKTLPFTITDAQSRSGSGSISLTVQSPPAPLNHVVISQLYGAGGNSGAAFTNDYIELYNPTATAFSLTGWSLQYASAGGTSWTNRQFLGGMIGPGEYYLVGLASGGATGSPLPPSNISGVINMSATTGKIALVNNGNFLSGGCPVGADPDIVDFVGYGSGATCREGAANAPAPSNTNAIFRNNNGSTDTDQNGSDFTAAAANPRRTAPIVELGPWVASTEPTSNGTNAPKDASMTINFSEPVDVVGAWYDITCVNSGQHNDATVASAFSSEVYVITPNTNFQFGEQCTGTIFKDQVHDQDLDDSGANTDTLFENYTWSFTVVGPGAAAPYPPSVHLTMGNPSNAMPLVTEPNNYLMEKPGFSLSYNRDEGTPNWVSWHLDTSWFGTLARVDTFRADPAVPPDWYRVQATDYFSSGFDRGHNTPNADRDHQDRIPINQETFLMTNMIPQAPDQNQGPWADMENDLRTIVSGGNEMYIVMGGHGAGGTGNNGYAETIASGRVTVPNVTWRVILVLPTGEDDVSRTSCGSRSIAVIMPNSNTFNGSTIGDDNWQDFIVSVDQVESLTGYDFFSNLPDAVEHCVEAGTNGVNPPGTAGQSVTTNEDTAVGINLTAVSPNNAPLTYTIVSGPDHGDLTGTDGNRTYTPDPNYFGSDSFSFKVNDGTNDSNISTVNITVNSVNDAPVGYSDSHTTNSNTPLNVAAPGVLGNDQDVEGNSLTAQLVSDVSNGTLALQADGSFNYTPDTDFTGTDSFTYRAFDGTDSSNVTKVTITVNDTVGPYLTSSVAVSLISSSNSNLFNVGLSVSATDNSGDPVTINVAVVGDENDQTPTINNTVHSPDAKNIAPGTLRLRGERVESGDGRVYLIIVTTTDSSGNVSRNYHTVVVPKGNSQARIDQVNAQAAAALSYAQTNNGATPPGYFVIGDGPIIGRKQ
ncbi:MAG: DNA/RNA non-specific endonuclease [Pyrinomonadaceae bacterium]|nr:DNA/RNA non-specific endonuclease [Pyrinomonadaceae bacterium]